MSWGIRSVSRGWAARAFTALVALLLGVQVALAYAPLEAPLAPGHIRSVICGPEGLQTVTIDLSDGSVEVAPAALGESRCPFCVIGHADLAAPFVAPDRPMVLQRVAYAAPAPQIVPARARDRARPIRAPPILPLTH